MCLCFCNNIVVCYDQVLVVRAMYDHEFFRESNIDNKKFKKKIFKKTETRKKKQ